MPTPYVFLAVIAYVIAVARVTRLINGDTILDGLRIAVARRFGPESTPMYFMACPWCVSMWAAFIGAPFLVWWTGLSWWFIPVLALAASHLVGVTARWTDLDDMEIIVDE